MSIIIPSKESEEFWKNGFLRTLEEVCGWIKKRNICKEFWWWDDGVNKVVCEKRYLWKAWKKGVVSEDEYLIAKRAARHIFYAAKKAAEGKDFPNCDIVEEKCLLDDNDKCVSTPMPKVLPVKNIMIDF